jgi:hypothetical protein
MQWIQAQAFYVSFFPAGISGGSVNDHKQDKVDPISARLLICDLV